MDKDISGTYWAVNCDGKIYITQGEKPIKVVKNTTTYIKSTTNSNWVMVGSNLEMINSKGVTVTGKDFQKCKFPEIELNGDPVEIEIGKSKKVYTY